MLTIRVWLVLIVFVLASAGIGFVVAPRTDAGFVDQAAVLTFVGMAAVGIERVIELLWALVGSRFGGWWPLKQFAEAFDTVEAETNALLEPIRKQAEDALKEFRTKLEVGSEKIKVVDAELASLEDNRKALSKQLSAALKLAPGSERMALLTGISSNASATLKSATTLAGDFAAEAQKAIDKADEAIGSALTVAESFSDNPARRVASILIGGALGMIAAGFLGLNIFSAVLGESAGYLAAGLGVILTGFVVGLGSSPTHELIKALQNFKQSKGTMVETRSDTGGQAPESLRVMRDGGRRADLGGPMADMGGGTSGRRVMLRGTQ